MTLLLSLGPAIVLSVLIFAAVFLWGTRQVKRVEAEREAEYRGLFQLEPLPPAGDEVQILIEEDGGRTYRLEAVHWPYLGWTDAVTLLRVEGNVLGWRRHPFGSHKLDHDSHEYIDPLDDPANWTRERLAAELAKLTSDDKHL